MADDAATTVPEVTASRWLLESRARMECLVSVNTAIMGLSLCLTSPRSVVDRAQRFDAHNARRRRIRVAEDRHWPAGAGDSWLLNANRREPS